MMLSAGLLGQQIGTQGEELLERVASELVERGVEGEMESLLEHFEDLLEAPLDINRATAEQLEGLYLLTDFQIASLLEYRSTGGDVLSAAELQLVHGFDKSAVDLIRPFVCFGSLATGSGISHRGGRGDLLVKGWWKKDTEEYLGPHFYSQMKYKWKYEEKLQLGITLEKDYGEEFLTGGVPMGDFLSFHFGIKDVGIKDVATISNAVLGDYLVRLGQGLVMWGGFSFSGGEAAQGFLKRGADIVPYTSSDENNFLRGAAATVKRSMPGYRSIALTMFFSLKDVDARIKDGKYTSLLTDGLHNTESSVAVRKSLGEIVYGASLQYNAMKMRIGVNWAGYGYDALCDRRVQDYNRYQIYQGQWGNCSIDMVALLGRTRVFGELAMDYGGSGALVAGISSRVGDWDLSGIVRSYSRSYIAPYAGAYSTISSCSNQSGIAFVAGKNFFKGGKFSVGGSYTFHPWERYNIGKPSSTAKLWGRWERSSEKCSWNIKLYGNWDSYGCKHKVGVKGMLAGEAARNLQLKLRWETVAWRMDKVGFGAGAEGVYGNGKTKVVLRCAYYNCRDWNTRLYMYEYDLPSSFSSTLMYGEGLKYYALVSCKMGRKTALYLKIDEIPRVKVGLKMRFF